MALVRAAFFLLLIMLVLIQFSGNSMVADALARRVRLNASSPSSGSSRAFHSSLASKGNYEPSNRGMFITTLAVGTPPVSFTAIVDTGSDLVWRQCKPCKSCYPQAPAPADGGAAIFNPSQSSTYTKASCKDPLCAAQYESTCHRTCKYEYLYGSTAFTRGDFAYDTLTIVDAASGRPRRFRGFGFGCGHDNESPYDFRGAGGIVGLGQGPLSLPSQLKLSQFSYCFQKTANSPPDLISPLFLNSPTASRGGHTLSTPIISSPSYPTLYYLNLKGISVGGHLLAIPAHTFQLDADGNGGVIIDTGTTFTKLAKPAHDAVLDSFRTRITSLPVADPTSSPYNDELNLCYRSKGRVPSLTFHFDGADLDLPSDNYFVSINELFCLAITQSSESISTLGNVAQQNYHVVYDLQARMLSFKRENCNAL